MIKAGTNQAIKLILVLLLLFFFFMSLYPAGSFAIGVTFDTYRLSCSIERPFFPPCPGGFLGLLFYGNIKEQKKGTRGDHGSSKAFTAPGSFFPKINMSGSPNINEEPFFDLKKFEKQRNTPGGFFIKTPPGPLKNFCSALIFPPWLLSIGPSVGVKSFLGIPFYFRWVEFFPSIDSFKSTGRLNCIPPNWAAPAFLLEEVEKWNNTSAG